SERSGAEALVIQLDSPGALVSVDGLVARIAHAKVPVAVWVGGTGARALGGAGRIALAAPITGLAPKARVERGNTVLNPEQAKQQGLVELNKSQSAVLGTFIASLDGRRAAGHTLDTATFTP